MSSPPAGHNGLTTCLAELERLGLVRPASVLVTQYLAALAAEHLIDAESATRVAAVYHRLRYGTLDRDDAQLREAAALLERAATNVGAMSEAARRSLAGRIAQRLQTESDSEPTLPRPAVAPVSAAAVRLDWQSLAIGNEHATDLYSFSPVDTLTPSQSNALKRRRDRRFRSLPLEAATLVMVGLIVVGYVLRQGVDRSIGPSQTELKPESPASGRPHVIARDAWRYDDYWMANLRQRAKAEAARGRDQPARLAYELLLIDLPRDAGALNELAWLNLTSHDAAIHDPKRGLELALRALAISRAPAILDTAAEGYFQNGQPDVAVKLEREALESLPRFAGFEDSRYLKLLRQQLEKFQNAAKATHSALSPAPGS